LQDLLEEWSCSITSAHCRNNSRSSIFHSNLWHYGLPDIMLQLYSSMGCRYLLTKYTKHCLKKP